MSQITRQSFINTMSSGDASGIDPNGLAPATEQAYSMLTNVMQNYNIMLKPDRMKDYPEDLRKWVTDSKPEADKMMELAKSKTHH